MSIPSIIGRVTDIQRFSLHDGPGIRTNIYMKGCNMHCAWCHNPETIHHKRQLQFHQAKCMGCGVCFAACASGALRAGEKGRIYDEEKCTRCGKCADACVTHALAMIGWDMTVEEVLAQVRMDKAYYSRSGGGVTITGGEPLMQADFVAAVLDACRAEAIGCAVETNLSLPWSTVQKVTSRCDVVMFDIKILSPEAHLRWTGEEVSRVLSNAKKLDETGVSLIVRTPIIPGVNDDAESIRAIARFLSQLHHLSYYELLPYNPLAAGKFHDLNWEYAFEDAKIPSKGKMSELWMAARECGVNVRLMEGGSPQ